MALLFRWHRCYAHAKVLPVKNDGVECSIRIHDGYIEPQFDLCHFENNSNMLLLVVTLSSWGISVHKNFEENLCVFLAGGASTANVLFSVDCCTLPATASVARRLSPTKAIVGLIHANSIVSMFPCWKTSFRLEFWFYTNVMYHRCIRRVT